MPVTHSAYQSTRTFGALDGLRALSVVAVIWQHTSGRPGPEFFSKGYFGVDFFFAISGFLITTLLLRERKRQGRISLRKFYIRRIFRIFPVYYAVLIVYTVLVFTTRRGTDGGSDFFANLPAFLTYTSNWFVDTADGSSVTFYFAWSLATEEQFYLFWPPLLVLFMLLRPKSVWHILSVLGILIVGSQIALASGSSSLAITIVSSLALPILLGVAAALLLDGPESFRRIAPVVGARWFSPLVFALMFASLSIPAPAQLTQTLMVLAVMSVCITEHTVFQRLLAFKPLAYVGVISYGIYLMHMLCANVVRVMLGGSFGTWIFAATTVLSIAVASLSFRFFESPMLRFGRRFGSNSLTDAAARLEHIEHPEPSAARKTVGPRRMLAPELKPSAAAEITTESPRNKRPSRPGH